MCPPVSTVRGSADIVESHCILSLRLEEYCLLVATFGTGMVQCFWERWIVSYIGNDLGQLINLMGDLIDIDAAVVCLLVVVTVPACIEQDTVVLVFFGIQHVVAFFTKPDTDEPWLICSTVQIHWNKRLKEQT